MLPGTILVHFDGRTRRECRFECYFCNSTRVLLVTMLDTGELTYALACDIETA